MTRSGAQALEAAVTRAEDLPTNDQLATSCTQEFDQWGNWDDTSGFPGDWGDVSDGGPGNW